MWIILGIITYLLFWLTLIVSYTIEYLTSTIQVTSFSQVLYTLNAGAEGAEGTIGTAVAGFFASKGVLLLAGTLIFAGFIYLCIRKNKAHKEGKPFFATEQLKKSFRAASIGTMAVVIALLGINIGYGYQILGIGDYMANASRVSDLYETNFVDPNSVSIEFPQKKKNLIYIVMESMENTYTDQEHGGGYKENLTPNLYELAKSGTDFSAMDTTDLNGALVADNTGWTVAGLVAQSAGVPLNVGNGEFVRNFRSNDKFMPALTTLGTLLKDAGYHNYFMCGSDAAYAGRANYFKQHGDYEILDVNEARREGFIPADYSEWWGYEDAKLYAWAQKKLPELAKNDQPFNLTMLTADTHFQDGYCGPDCDKDEFDSQYKNVIAASDRQVAAFVKWVQQQDFYKDTTIVITGDHLSMDGSVPKETSKGYQRKALAMVINGPEYKLNKTREFTTMDMFPTILEALGVKIEGHRLGLGTSLYADEATLAETLGLAALNGELVAESDFYNKVLMSGDETRFKEDSKKDETPAQKEEENKPNQEDPAIAAPSAQEYQSHQASFENPDYIYVAPAPAAPVYQPPVQNYVPEPAPAPEPEPTPEPAPAPGSQEPAPTPEPTPTPAPDPGTSQKPTPAPDPGSQEPAPTPEPTPTPTPTPDPVPPTPPVSQAPSGGEISSGSNALAPIIPPVTSQAGGNQTAQSSQSSQS